MSGISSNNQLLAVIASSRRRGPGYITVADEAERYALTDIEPGQLVFQEDDEVTYQLNAPSEAQGGVFVSGGTLDGIYSILAPPLIAIGSTKTEYVLLGQDNFGDVFYSIVWGLGGPRWGIYNFEGNGIYYSLSDVATPDLASDWLNASDDTPAGITLTSIPQGELDAGVTVAGAGSTEVNGIAVIEGNSEGRNSYKLSSWIIFAGSWNVMSDNGSLGLYNDGVNLTAFPWEATYDSNEGGILPAPTVTRNDIAAPANWTPV